MKLPHVDLSHLLHIDIGSLDFAGYADMLAELDGYHDPETMQAIRRFATSGGGVWRRTVRFE